MPTSPTQPATIRVDAVRIANFRSLKNVEVLLSPTTILVGMNNSGKTSFLRALHLALGADRRILTLDDFHLGTSGDREAIEMLIDFRIIPVDVAGARTDSFDQIWIESDFGGDVIAIDSDDREFIGLRTRVTFDSVKSDFMVDRRLLKQWSAFENWQDPSAQLAKAPRRFEQVLSFFIDAQRDAVVDLRNRSSYVGKLLSKIDISEEAIARTCAVSPAVFAYDLVNEPVAAGKLADGWYMGRMGEVEFCQRLSLDPGDRKGDEIFREWTKRMVSAIREHDPVHLITMGMFPFPGAYRAVAEQLDFVSPHLYPKTGKVDDEIELLKKFDWGNPVVIGETFPLSCGVDEERDFLLKSRPFAHGWIGHWPDESPAELAELKKTGKATIHNAIWLSWVDLFKEIGPQMRGDTSQ